MSLTLCLKTAEEVRVGLIELLAACLDSDKQQFVPQMSTVAAMLGRAASDSNPEMKQKVATFAGSLSRELSASAGAHMRGVVIGLT